MLNNEQKLLLAVLRGENITSVDLKIDWVYLINLSKKHKVFPYMMEHIRELIPVEYRYYCEEEYRKQCKYQEKLWGFFKELLQILNNQGKCIKIILPKGFPVSLELYGNIYSRPSGDVDLLVDENDILTVCETLNEMGFYHRRNGNISEVVDALVSGKYYNFYELKYLFYDKGETYWFEVKKATDAIPFAKINMFLNNTKKVEFDGITFNALQDEFLLLHLCSNAYKDTMCYEGIVTDVFRLRNFLDIFLFFERREFDYQRFMDVSKQINMISEVRWALSFVKALFPSINTISKFRKLMDCLGGDIISSMEICPEEYIYNNNLVKEAYLSGFYKNNLRLELKGKFVEKNYGISIKRIGMELEILIPKSVLDGEKRVYFSFIRIPDDEGEIDGFAALHSKGYLVYQNEKKYYLKQAVYEAWPTYYQTSGNRNIQGEIIKDVDLCSQDISIILPYDEEYAGFNYWIDAPVLKDYYKHLSFFTDPDQAPILLNIIEK